MEPGLQVRDGENWIAAAIESPNVRHLSAFPFSPTHMRERRELLASSMLRLVTASPSDRWLPALRPARRQSTRGQPKWTSRRSDRAPTTYSMVGLSLRAGACRRAPAPAPLHPIIHLPRTAPHIHPAGDAKAFVVSTCYADCGGAHTLTRIPTRRPSSFPSRHLSLRERGKERGPRASHLVHAPSRDSIPM